MDKNEKKSVRFRSRFHQSFASFLSAERKGPSCRVIWRNVSRLAGMAQIYARSCPFFGRFRPLCKTMLAIKASGRFSSRATGQKGPRCRRCISSKARARRSLSSKRWQKPARGWNLVEKSRCEKRTRREKPPPRFIHLIVVVKPSRSRIYRAQPTTFA